MSTGSARVSSERAARAIVARLRSSSTAPGAEVDAFQTATLDRILIEPGVQITFASGHDWRVQVVPEPGTVLLWLAGLAAILPLARRRRVAACCARPLSGPA